jgi:hypothetical protein
MSATQVLRNTSAILQVTFYSDETATSADGAVTITITRADGTALVTAAATSNPSTGVYRYTLAAQANLDYLTAVWSGTFSGTAQSITSYVELVGGYYATLPEIRALPNLSDTAKFTTAELTDARQWIETLVEDVTGVAWVPRYSRDLLDGAGTYEIILNHMKPRTLLALTVGGTAVTTTSFDLYESGRINRYDAGSTFAIGRRNVVASYEHGYDSPPNDLKRAALTAIRYRLLTDQNQTIPDRALSMTNEFGNIQMAQPGPNRPTGIPEVDAVINRWIIKGKGLLVG